MLLWDSLSHIREIHGLVEFSVRAVPQMSTASDPEVVLGDTVGTNCSRGPIGEVYGAEPTENTPQPPKLMLI